MSWLKLKGKTEHQEFGKRLNAGIGMVIVVSQERQERRSILLDVCLVGRDGDGCVMKI